MVNLRGELVGINTAIMSRSGGNQGIGLAVPINMARNIMNQIIQHGEVTRGYLDLEVQDLTPGLSEAMGLRINQGALIQEVSKGGVAEQAGLRPGDVIVKLNNREVSNADEFLTRIARTSPGAGPGGAGGARRRGQGRARERLGFGGRRRTEDGGSHPHRRARRGPDRGTLRSP